MRLKRLGAWFSSVAALCWLASLLAGPAAMRALAADDGDPLAMEFVAPAWFPAADAASGRWAIYLDGRIDSAAGERFTEEVARRDIASADVYVNSRGGALVAAMELGRAIHRLGFATYVGRDPEGGPAPRPGDCFSACVFVLIGGHYRFAVPQSRIGVHRFSSTASADADPDRVQMVSATIINYIKVMGIDVALFDRMSRAGKDEILFLAQNDLAQLRVINNGRLPPEWEIEPSTGGVYVKATQQTRWGSGRIMLSCRGGQIVFQPFYEAGDNAAEIADAAVGHLLRTGSGLDALGEPLNRSLRAEGRYVTGEFVLTPDQARALQDAKSIGYAVQLRGSISQAGFWVDAAGGASQKIRGLLANCG